MNRIEIKQMIWITLFVVMVGCSAKPKEHSEVYQPKQPLTEALVRLSNSFTIEVDSLGFPRCLEPNGEVRGVPSKDWTSGFYPGSLWLAYGVSKDEKYKDLAQKWLVFS
jgi:unsaturated chondroitin disaccharide hydrolase